jgi:Family of unknown function (DUF5824)
MEIPIRYLPKGLSKKDKLKQIAELLKSRKMYKKGKFYTRNKIKTYSSKESKHIKNARRIYKVDKIIPNKILALKTGCSVKGLRQIVRKGEGAYFSSGSRPSQTAQSWGIARLASSITGGKASSVDLDIIRQECKPSGRAYKMAIKTKGFGRKTTKHVKI